MNIIGISGLHHSVPFKKKELPHLSRRQHMIVQGRDSAAALINDSGIQAVAAEERFNREKGSGSFPVNAIRYCLQAAGLSEAGINFIAHAFAYESFRSFFEADEYARRQFHEVYSRNAQIRTIEQHLKGNNDWSRKLIHVPHHLAHAASSFYLSGLNESLILVADGMGEIHSTTIAVGNQNSMKIIKQVRAVHSLGLLYGVVTLYLGFVMGLDEYKVMGLAPYGDPHPYLSKMMELIQLHKDGTYSIPILFQNITLQERETYDGTLRQMEELFGPRRQPESEISRRHMDVAAALQTALQTCLMHILRHCQRETGQVNLCMAGGVALNCTANGWIHRSRMFRKIFIQPAAGDDGSALGAALFVKHAQDAAGSRPAMTLPFWGPSYQPSNIESLLRQKPELRFTFYDCFDRLAQEIAKRLAEEQIIGWFRGRLEFGPRALGNRSILADPRKREMRQRINRMVKKREEFRPFAPAVTSEAASQFFEIAQGEESIFATMLFVAQVKRIYRDQLPAVTHVDGSARVQTVSRTEHPQFWTLLNEFGKLTGFPIVLNTSFNVRGQPIVCSPEEALQTFLSAELDALAMEDYLIERWADHV